MASIQRDEPKLQMNICAIAGRIDIPLVLRWFGNPDAGLLNQLRSASANQYLQRYEIRLFPESAEIL